MTLALQVPVQDRVWKRIERAHPKQRDGVTLGKGGNND